MIKEAIRNRLLGDAAIIAAVGEFEFSTGSLDPAIFTTQAVPKDCESVSIIISEASGDRFGCRGNRGGDSHARVRVYGDRVMSDKDLWDLAYMVWRRLDRCTLTYTGYENVGVMADPPVELGDDPDGFPGWMIDVRCILMEND